MQSIWAVATNTIKQALRMKIAAVFVVLLIVLLPVMGVSMTGDGTLKGRLQTFVSYGLSLTSFLLCLLTIVVSIYSLTSDIKQRQIYTVITKPIRRFQLLFGKLLGVILLDIALLVLFAGIIYSITVCIYVFLGEVLSVILLGEASLILFAGIIYTLTIHTRVLWKVLGIISLSLVLVSLIFFLVYTVSIYTPDMTRITEAELAEARNEFFTARVGLTPDEVDVSQEVLEAYEKLKKSRRLPEGVPREKIIAKLTEDRKRWKRAAVPGQSLIWEFQDVKPLDPNQSLFIRFKYDVSVNPPDLQVYSRWAVGDDRQHPPDVEIFDSKDTIRTFCEIDVLANVVAEDGYLAVGFLNVPLNNTVVIFPPEDGLEVLYQADTFTANFIRAVLLILFRLIFLACLGILASTFLSFPVAILLCLVVFFTATVSGFCLESFDFLGENLSWVYSYTIRPVILLLPQFDKFNPTKPLVSARLLSWSLLAKVAGLMICIKALLLLLLAFLIFRFREIARIII